jgi:hypothetical protein
MRLLDRENISTSYLPTVPKENRMKNISYNKIAELLRNKPIATLANTSMGGFNPSMNPNGYHAESLIDDFCDLFQENNPNFNKRRFIKACGFEPWDEVIMGIPVINEENE